MTEEEIKQVIEDLSLNEKWIDFREYTMYMGLGFKQMFDKALKNKCIPRDLKTGRFIKYKSNKRGDR